MHLLHVWLWGATIHGLVTHWTRDLLALVFPVGVALLSHSALTCQVGECCETVQGVTQFDCLFDTGVDDGLH